MNYSQKINDAVDDIKNLSQKLKNIEVDEKKITSLEALNFQMVEITENIAIQLLMLGKIEDFVHILKSSYKNSLADSETIKDLKAKLLK